MALAHIHDKYLTYANRKFYTTGADSVRIGSYGEKERPLLSPNRLKRWKDIDIPPASLDEVLTVDIDFERSNEAALKGAIEENLIGEARAEGTYEKLRSGDLKLMKLAIAAGDMIDHVNALPDVLEKLLEYRASDRVCHEVFVVMQAELAEQMAAAGKVRVEGSGGGMDVEAEVGGGGGGRMSLTISSGATFAYAMFKPKWNRPWYQTATRIQDYTSDYYGL